MKNSIVAFLFCLVTVCHVGAVNLVPAQVNITDCSTQKPNFFFEIIASSSQATYHLCLDVWPANPSIIGTFTISNGTIGRAFSSLRKGNNTYYYFYDDCPAELTISKINEDTCQLSAHFFAAQGESETRYEYVIASFRFAYKAGKEPDDPTDPYRFEPAEPVQISFSGAVVKVRDNRETWGTMNIHLVDSANQKLDWIELDFRTDSFAMPQGVFSFSADSSMGTFIASPGNKNKQDYPSYIAIRGEEWGTNTTVYYIKNGTLTFSLNARGDTVSIQGTITSQHGSICTINVTAYNDFYVPPIPPRPQEEKELEIDSVVISYIGERNGLHEYEFNFFFMQDFPNLIFNLLLHAQNALEEGDFTMANEDIYATLLFQDQEDFNNYFHYGINYRFVSFCLTLTDRGNSIWQYALDMVDEQGSHYYFTFSQNPHLIEPTALEIVKEKRSPIKVLRNHCVEIYWNGSHYNLLGIPF